MFTALPIFSRAEVAAELVLPVKAHGFECTGELVPADGEAGSVVVVVLVVVVVTVAAAVVAVVLA